MKKTIIFLVLFVGIFGFLTHFAQAETITQTIPIRIEQQEQTPFDNFLQRLKETFLPQVFAEEITKTFGGKNSGMFCSRAEGSWKTCNDYVQFTTNIKICTANRNLRPDDVFRLDCNQDACTYQPKSNTYVCGYDLWKIKKAVLKTAYLEEGADDWNQCLMTVNILSGSSKTKLATPSQVYCVNSSGNTNTVIADFNNPNAPSGAVEIITELHGKTFDGVGTWYGELTLTGTRPSMGGFSATAKNYATGQSQTVGAGKTLDICKGESVKVSWSSQDTADVTVFVGSPQKVYKGTSGSATFTPALDTNIYIGGSGYAGYEYLQFFFEDPINIKLHPCTPGGSPWVTISANPKNLTEPGTSKLTWNSGNVEKCWAMNTGDWDGVINNSGSKVVNVSETTEYKIWCRSSIDHSTIVKASATVTVAGAGACDYTKNDEDGKNDACSGVTKCCSDDNKCVLCQPLPPTGTLDVRVRLDGKEITGKEVGGVLFGIVTQKGKVLERGAPNTYKLASGKPYVLKYISGGPEGAVFKGFSPMSSVVLSADQKTIVYMDFGFGGRCNITVQALKAACDGTNPVQWTGPLSYALLGPIILNGTAVNQTFENIPAGNYYLTELVGGPGTYNGVTPGNPVACSDGDITLTMKFNDCGATYSKCNYATGVCSLCSAYSEECKYSSLTECNQTCSGCATEHKPKADIFCWANFDSDECVGVNDNNSNTPSVILYDRTSDTCGDVKNCLWEIYDSTGKLLKSVNTCSPYTWYDETPGVYTGKLIVTDSNGDTSTDTQKFTIKNVDALTCNFVWDPDSPTVSGKISFFDQSLTPAGTTLSSWAWTFEDASPASSTAKTVQDVVFSSAGAKTVKITVKNSAGATCTLTKEITVKTINPNWKETIPF